jgi:uncharacterized protein YndB with AHSA1/START domain
MTSRTTGAGALDLAMTRRIPAPPEAVFAAVTEAEQVRQWWGPYGMETPVAEVELRRGGRHRTVMRDATGKEYPTLLSIEEVAAPRRLLLRVPQDGDEPLAGAAAELGFHADPVGTRLEVVWRHPTAEMRAAHEAMGFAKGWGETLDKLTAHVLRPAAAVPGGVPPTPEHGWLHRLLGEWSYETEAMAGPGQPPETASGRERVRSLGGYWVIGEAEGTMPGGGFMRWTMTMGFDPKARRFRGTWVGSMMPAMFLYDGALEEDGRTLTLESEGPSFTGEGTARYRDVVAMEGDDRRTMRSLVLGADGAWTEFMKATFRRTV